MALLPRRSVDGEPVAFFAAACVCGDNGRVSTQLLSKMHWSGVYHRRTDVHVPLCLLFLLFGCHVLCHAGSGDHKGW